MADAGCAKQESEIWADFCGLSLSLSARCAPAIEAYECREVETHNESGLKYTVDPARGRSALGTTGTQAGSVCPLCNPRRLPMRREQMRPAVAFVARTLLVLVTLVLPVAAQTSDTARGENGSSLSSFRVVNTFTVDDGAQRTEACSRLLVDTRSEPQADGARTFINVHDANVALEGFDKTLGQTDPKQMRVDTSKDGRSSIDIPGLEGFVEFCAQAAAGQGKIQGLAIGDETRVTITLGRNNATPSSFDLRLKRVPVRGSTPAPTDVRRVVFSSDAVPLWIPDPSIESASFRVKGFWLIDGSTRSLFASFSVFDCEVAFENGGSGSISIGQLVQALDTGGSPTFDLEHCCAPDPDSDCGDWAWSFQGQIAHLQLISAAAPGLPRWAEIAIGVSKVVLGTASIVSGLTFAAGGTVLSAGLASWIAIPIGVAIVVVGADTIVGGIYEIIEGITGEDIVEGSPLEDAGAAIGGDLGRHIVQVLKLALALVTLNSADALAQARTLLGSAITLTELVEEHVPKEHPDLIDGGPDPREEQCNIRTTPATQLPGGSNSAFGEFFAALDHRMWHLFNGGQADLFHGSECEAGTLRDAASAAAVRTHLLAEPGGISGTGIPNVDTRDADLNALLALFNQSPPRTTFNDFASIHELFHAAGQHLHGHDDHGTGACSTALNDVDFGVGSITEIHAALHAADGQGAAGLETWFHANFCTGRGNLGNSNIEELHQIWHRLLGTPATTPCQ